MRGFLGNIINSEGAIGVGTGPCARIKGFEGRFWWLEPILHCWTPKMRDLETTFTSQLVPRCWPSLSKIANP